MPKLLHVYNFVKASPEKTKKQHEVEYRQSDCGSEEEFQFGTVKDTQPKSE